MFRLLPLDILSHIQVIMYFLSTVYSIKRNLAWYFQNRWHYPRTNGLAFKKQYLFLPKSV